MTAGSNQRLDLPGVKHHVMPTTPINVAETKTKNVDNAYSGAFNLLYPDNSTMFGILEL